MKYPKEQRTLTGSARWYPTDQIEHYWGTWHIYVWYPTKSSSYSEKSGYTAEISLYKPLQPLVVTSTNWNKAVWTATCSPKHKLLIWKILHDAISKGDNLIKRGVSINSICSHWRNENYRSPLHALQFHVSCVGFGSAKNALLLYLMIDFRLCSRSFNSLDQPPTDRSLWKYLLLDHMGSFDHV